MKSFVNLFIVCFIIFLSGCSSLPSSEIISEPPSLTGHIVEIKKDKQVFAIVKNITKEEAVNNISSEVTNNEIWIELNGTKIESSLQIGDKVAIWLSPEAKSGTVASHVVVLER